MKILRRLSLNATIYRWNEYPPSSGYLLRKQQARLFQKMLTPEEELVKYGYDVKHSKITWIHFFSTFAVFMGVSFYLYLVELSRNELKSRNKYRIIENNMSSLLIYLHRAIFKFVEFLHVNTFLIEFMNPKSSQDVNRMTEISLRYNQYQHYKKHKDSTFQFMDLGIFEKYPYPQQKQQS